MPELPAFKAYRKFCLNLRITGLYLKTQVKKETGENISTSPFWE
jgi:hypothetical protein